MKLLSKIVIFISILLLLYDCESNTPKKKEIELRYIKVNQKSAEPGIGVINYVLYFSFLPKNDFDKVQLKHKNDSFPFAKNTYTQQRDYVSPSAVFIQTDFLDMDTLYIKNTFQQYFINNTLYFFNDSTMIDSCIIKDKIKIIFNE